jgi:hypothetical protein
MVALTTISFTRRPDTGTPKAGARSAFTLFEVALSLVILSFGVVSVIMLYPVGLRELTSQRYRLYASCIANELIDVYGNADASQVCTDAEGPGPWDVNADRRTNAPDLEIRCSNQRYGLMPVPLEIARRIDSDNEEIKAILDDGGYIYYIMPNVPNAWREDLLQSAPPNDLQKMIIAVAGSAQHNASTSFPMKRWPYYSAVPGPPLHVIHNPSTGWDAGSPTATAPPPGDFMAEDPSLGTVWCANHGTYCWASLADRDPQAQNVFNAFWNYMLVGQWTTPAVPGPPIPASAGNGGGANGYPRDITPAYTQALGNYLAATISYAQSAGLSAAQITGWMTAQPPAAYPFGQAGENTAAKQLLALNYLSHALMCLTRWHKLDSATAMQTGSTATDLTAGVSLAASYPPGPRMVIGPGGLIHHGDIVNLVRNTRYFYYRFCAQNPYNWAVPRPIEHATMMDYGLFELDLFRPPMSGPIWGAPAGTSPAQQWRYLSPTRISTVGGDASGSLGPPMTYPETTLSAATSFSEDGPTAGQLSHFTILNQFEASERDRELVFWAVDWQSYEDCETAMSAPLDASRYPRAAPGGVKPANAGGDGRGLDYRAAPCATFDDLMWGFTDGWGDVTGLEQTVDENGNNASTLPFHRALIGSYVHAYRNPEKNMLFASPVAQLPTGADVTAIVAPMRDVNSAIDMTTQAGVMSMNNPPDYGPPSAAGANGVTPPQIFCGTFGADRNGNGKLDRGNVPRSVRLRAVSVARFNFYDMRVPCQIK